MQLTAEEHEAKRQEILKRHRHDGAVNTLARTQAFKGERCYMPRGEFHGPASNKMPIVGVPIINGAVAMNPARLFA